MQRGAVRYRQRHVLPHSKLTRNLEYAIEHFRRQPPEFPELQDTASTDHGPFEVDIVIRKWLDWIHIPQALHRATAIYETLQEISADTFSMLSAAQHLGCIRDARSSPPTWKYIETSVRGDHQRPLPAAREEWSISMEAFDPKGLRTSYWNETRICGYVL